ncbi:hypothetical protein AB0G73_31995 [Streptomyces sp. NPDC020719]|uniref:hypothetical protein n=1 Tax=Streptomyces sp. NPDC020719 TaxID=3154896 RepID=UPI0033E89D3E
MAVTVAGVAAASVFATAGFADAAEAGNVDRAEVSATTQVVTPELFLPADESAPAVQDDGLEDRFLALPANPSTEQVLATMYPDDPAAQQRVLAQLSQPESEAGAQAGSGFSWGGAWKVTKCVGAIGAFVAGNAVLVSKLRKLGGVWKGARLVVKAGDFQDRMKALTAMFGEVTGLSTVAKSCG